MSQLAINGVNTEASPGLLTWKELLFDLESRRLEAGEIISAVRFNGDEVADFRDDDVLRQPLESIEKIGVETIDRVELGQSALADAQKFVKSLEGSMVDVAESFRTSLPDPANSSLHQLLDGIKMLAALVRGIELTLGAPRSGASTVEHTLKQMSPTLVDLISAQEKQDWTLVADILEYELLAYFSGFEQVLNGFRKELGLEKAS